MILAIGVVAVAAVGYAVYKHVTVAQVKAEVAKIEAEIPTLVAAAPAVVKDIVARLKAIL